MHQKRTKKENAASPPRKIAFLGGYEPRRCGIATFTHDLCEAVSNAAPDSTCMVGAMNDRIEGYHYPAHVRFELLEQDLHSYRRAADFLNFSNADVLSVQHEFGIYGGPAGSHLLTLLRKFACRSSPHAHRIARPESDSTKGHGRN